MNKKWMPHIIAVAAFAVFIALGLACASMPDEPHTLPGVTLDILRERAKDQKLVIISSAVEKKFTIITIEGDIQTLQMFANIKLDQYNAAAREATRQGIIDTTVQIYARATDMDIYKGFAAFALPPEQKNIAIRGLKEKSELLIIKLDPAKPCQAFIVEEDTVAEIADYENYDFGNDYRNGYVWRRTQIGMKNGEPVYRKEVSNRYGRNFIKIAPPKNKR